MSLQALWEMLKESGTSWVEDKAARLGAALAYYAIFSIAPLLVIAIGVSGLFFEPDAAQAQITEQVRHLVGEEGGRAIGAMVAGTSKSGGGLATAVGVVMLLAGAGGLFVQLQDALNTVWEVQPRPGRAVWEFIRERLLSFTMVAGVAFLLLVSLVVSAALAAVGSLLGDLRSSVGGLIVQTIIDLVVIIPLFAAIYRVLPDARIAWGDVWLGASVTAVLFIIGKFLIGLYLGSSGVASAYGAVGSLAVLLLWLYYAAQVFLFGAELTKVYANRFGSRVVPKPHAEPVTEEARAQQGIPRDEDRKEPALTASTGAGR